MRADFKADVFQRRCNTFAADEGGVVGEDEDLGKRCDVVVFLRGEEVLSNVLRIAGE